MKRFLFPVVFGVCIAGCLVDTGCAAIGAGFDDALLKFVGGDVQETPDTPTPAPAIPTPEAELAALKVASEEAARFAAIRLANLEATVNEPIVPESVPTWLAGITTLLALVIPSKGVTPIGKGISRTVLRFLGIKTK